MLQNAYFLAKIGADTAKNEQHFAEILPIGRRVADRVRAGGTELSRLASEWHAQESAQRSGSALPNPERVRVRGLESAKLANFAKFCKFLAGSFSAVSKRNFARKYAFDSIFQALQDLHLFAPLQSQNCSKKSV